MDHRFWVVVGAVLVAWSLGKWIRFGLIYYFSRAVIKEDMRLEFAFLHFPSTLDRLALWAFPIIGPAMIYFAK